MTISISDVFIFKKEYPLKKPYKLSFKTLTSFISIEVIIKLESGDERLAEVVPLFGYSHESESVIWSNIQRHSKNVIGKTLVEARKYFEEFVEEIPFSMSPLLTAIDLFEFDSQINKDKVPKTIIPIDTSIFKEDVFNVDSTIKVKLSGDPKIDIAFFREMINSVNPITNCLRLDANQGYTTEQAVEFYTFINDNLQELPQIEYVEQPLSVGNWEGVDVLVEEFTKVPTMLDESIVTINDLDRAITLKVPFVKLKLFKQGGIKELLQLSEHAHKKGVQLILGNGVATWISNKIELCIFTKYNHYYYKEHEANGYLKVKV